MQKFNTVPTAAQIRTLQIEKSAVMGYDYEYSSQKGDQYFITIDGERKVCFPTAKDQRKAFEKIRRMGFGWGWKMPQLTDEEKGIIQAAENGENAFECKIISR